MFSKKNLELCLVYLLAWGQEPLSIQAVTFLTTECIYGSAMEDSLDMATLQAVFSKFCCKEVRAVCSVQ